MRRPIDSLAPRPYDLTVLAARLEAVTVKTQIVVLPETAQVMARALRVYADLIGTPSEERGTFSVDVWTREGGLCETIARAGNMEVARAAFLEARKHRPTHVITLRQGIRVIVEHAPDPPDTSTPRAIPPDTAAPG